MKDTNCPKCKSKLVISSEVELSKRIRCPQCKKEFDNPYYESPTSKLFRSINLKKHKTIYSVIGIVLILIIIGYSTSENNSIYITQSGYYGAYNKEVLDQFTEYSIHKDYEAINQLIRSGEIVKIPNGEKVYLVKVNLATVKIRVKGETTELWTVNEAIKRE